VCGARSAESVLSVADVLQAARLPQGSYSANVPSSAVKYDSSGAELGRRWPVHPRWLHVTSDSLGGPNRARRTWPTLIAVCLPLQPQQQCHVTSLTNSGAMASRFLAAVDCLLSHWLNIQLINQGLSDKRCKLMAQTASSQQHGGVSSVCLAWRHVNDSMGRITCHLPRVYPQWWHGLYTEDI